MTETSGSTTDSRSLAPLLQQRYREAVSTLPAWNETLDTLLSHRSVRAYLPDRLPKGTLELLVAAAQSAPTSSNLQAWSVIAVEDPARKARLAALAGDQKHIVEAPVLLVWLVDLRRLERIGAREHLPTGGLDYLESFLLGAVDAALAAQNAVTALESLGLGSVYIGAIRNKPLEVAAELGLPPHVFAVFGLVVGRPDPARPADVKPRLPQEAVFFRETYPADAPAERDLAAYNAHMHDFQAEQGLPRKDWTRLTAARIRDAAALHGRDKLAEALHTLGFRLE